MIIVVDPVFNPNKTGNVSSATKLGPGVTIAKFLGAYGEIELHSIILVAMMIDNKLRDNCIYKQK